MIKAQPRLVLILGGARSGKSSFAEQLAAHYAPKDKVLYVATAEYSDSEMTAKILRHRSERPSTWHTLEAPLHPALGVSEFLQQAPARVILLDCLTLLSSNWLLSLPETATPEEYHGLETELHQELVNLLAIPSVTLVIVSNEVGMGLVPPYPLGRVYRDVLGRLNQYVAHRADAVYLMVAGLPLEIKALARWPWLTQLDQSD